MAYINSSTFFNSNSRYHTSGNRVYKATAMPSTELPTAIDHPLDAFHHPHIDIESPIRENLEVIRGEESTSLAAILSSRSSVRMDCCDDYVPQDGISALQALDDPFEAFHPTLTDSKISHHNYDTCPLFALPRELRDMIYIYLIAAGHVKLAQASRSCAREFMEIAERWGIFRVKVDWKGRPFPDSRHMLSRPFGQTVPHLNIVIVVGEMVRSYVPCKHRQWLKKYFKDATVPRKSCHIVINSSPTSSAKNIDFRILSQNLSLLGGFEHVTIEMGNPIIKGPWGKVLLRCELKKVGDGLRRLLGDSAILESSDVGSPCLEFRPRAYLEACTGRNQPAVREDDVNF